MFTLKRNVEQKVLNKVGLSVAQIASMSSEELNKHLEKRLRKKIPMGYPDSRIEARGSVYLILRRFLSRKKRDKKLAKI